MEAKVMELAKALAEQTVLDPEGHVYQLSDSWKAEPVVLAFIRHFG